MKQSITGTEERIISAAVRLFSRQGYNGTTTREIARLADVNEGTLFRCFGRKVDLFWAAVQSQVARVRLGRELQNGMATDREPAVIVPMLFEFLVMTLLYQPDLMRLLQFSALELRPGAERVFRKELGPLFGSVRSYLDRCVERGAIRAVDTFMTTVAFATTVNAHQTVHELLTGNSLPYANSQEAVNAYSCFWLAALVPPAADKQDVVAASSLTQ